MDLLSKLPAVVLPNDQNNQDTLVVCSSGERVPLSNLLDLFTHEIHLRFMVKSDELNTPQNPRITWQIEGGTIIISAAFLYSLDTHGRTTSAAIIFESTNFPDGEIKNVLQKSEVIKALLEYLSINKNSMLAEITNDQRLKRILGGEIKKKLPGRNQN
jgi:hypothetical protein